MKNYETLQSALKEIASWGEERGGHWCREYARQALASIENIGDRVEELEKMLKQATRFEIAEDIVIEKRGKDKWCVVVFGGTVLDSDLNRHYEPMPSSRTAEFIAATRFTLEDAYTIAKRYKE